MEYYQLHQLPTSCNSPVMHLNKEARTAAASWQAWQEAGEASDGRPRIKAQAELNRPGTRSLFYHVTGKDWVFLDCLEIP